MYRRGLFTLLLFFHAMAGQAQHVLEGWVRDSLQRPVASAFVSLVDSSMHLHAQEITDAEGYFKMEGRFPERALLIIEALGYREKRLPVEWGRNARLRLASIVLEPFAMNIEQVVIEGQRYEIKENGDSTIYKAEDYLEGNERNVEDALKKLPGVEVDKDGIVYLRGKRVSKVMLEDDDLTGSNYTLLTRNLSVDLVEEFHFVDNYEDNPALRGLSQTDELILNLKVKKKSFGKFVGSVSLASGADVKTGTDTWRREVSASLLYLWAKGQAVEEAKAKRRVNKLVSLTNHNNTGNDLMNRYSFDPFGSSPFDFGDVRDGYLNDFYLQSPVALQKQRNLFNDGVKSLNTLIFRPAADWKSTATVLYYEDRVQQAFSESSRYAAAGAAFSRAYEHAEQLHEWLGGIRLRQFVELNQEANIELNTVWQQNNRPFSQTNRTFIDGLLADRLAQAQQRRYFAQDHELKLTKRWNKHHAWVVSAYYHADSLREALDARTQADRYADFFGLDFAANGVEQEVLSYFERWGGQLQGVYRLSPRSYWEYTTHYKAHKERLQGSTVIQGDNNERFAPVDFGKPQSLEVQEVGAMLSHHYAITKALKWRSSLHARRTYAKRRQADAEEHSGFWLGSASTSFAYEKKSDKVTSTWSFIYDYQTQLPTLRSVHGMLYLPNFDRIYTGADSLAVLRSHSFNLSLSRYHGFASWLRWNLSYTYHLPASSSRFRFAPLLDYTQLIWAGNSATLAQNIEWEFPLYFINSKAHVELNASRTQSLNEGIGVGERRFVAYALMPAVFIESRFFGWFNYYAGAEMEQSMTSVEEAGSTFSFDNRYFNAYLNFSLRFWDERLLWKINNQVVYLPEQKDAYHFLDTEISINWHEEGRFPLFIRAYNLTDRQVLQINASSDVAGSTRSFNLLPRYVLLGCRLSW